MYLTWIENGVFNVDWWNLRNGSDCSKVTTIQGGTDYDDGESDRHLPQPGAPPQLFLFQFFDLLLQKTSFGLVRAPQFGELPLVLEPQLGECGGGNAFRLDEPILKCPLGGIDFVQ